MQTFELQPDGTTRMTCRSRKASGTVYDDEYFVCILDAAGKCVSKQFYQGEFCRETVAHTYDASGFLTGIRTVTHLKDDGEVWDYTEVLPLKWNENGQLMETCYVCPYSREIITTRRNEFGEVICRETDRMKTNENGNVLEMASRPSGRSALMIHLPSLSPRPDVQWYDHNYVWKYENDESGRFIKKTM